jgi:hypothetical protein
VSWLIWAVLLVLQQASQTWTMRVRNSDNLRENAVASVCSNGVWIVSILIVAPFYVCFTVLGSVWMHWWLLRRDAKTHNWMRKPAR